MQFLPGGPHIPDELIQNLEDENVVLFCGAGVSKNAGLPLFDGLVKEVYVRLHQAVRGHGEPSNEEEHDEFQAKNFDRVLGLLENRLGSRDVVRNAVRDILELPPGVQLPFHCSILELARTSGGAFRLVTTNFDRGFLAASDGHLLCDVAPMLPPAKADRWKRPVHLHGLIGAEGRSLEDLVLTSADFGDAYITSGWASRFVTELFSRFSVVFLGYSVNDPAMRYLVDALAVDRVKRAHSHSVYSFVPSDVSDEEAVRAAWKAKGIEAIVYHWDASHGRLTGTIRAWADLHQSGQAGRLGVVNKYGSISPAKPYNQDHRVSQMIWALRDPTGQAARKFAQFAPPPPIEWLEPLEASGLMGPANLDSPSGTWCSCSIREVHPTSRWLHAWILQHLDKREVVERVIASNGILDPHFRWLLRRRLVEVASDLAEPYRQFWLLVSSGVAFPLLFESQEQAIDAGDDLQKGSTNPLLRHSVLGELQPLLKLSKPIMHLFDNSLAGSPRRLRDLAEIDVALRCGSDAGELRRAMYSYATRDPDFLVGIVWELTGHLRLTMDLYAAAELANRDYDPSVYQQQSLIDESPELIHSWTILIGLLRKAFERATAVDPGLARALVECWLRTPYPVFRRLALFGISRMERFGDAATIRILFGDEERLLWPYYTREFATKLLAAACKDLHPAEFDHVLTKLLGGPPRSMFRSDISDDDYRGMVHAAVFGFLSAIEVAGKTLPEEAQDLLRRLRKLWGHDQTAHGGSEGALSTRVDWSGDTWAESTREFDNLTVGEVFDAVMVLKDGGRRQFDQLQVWAMQNPLPAFALVEKCVAGEVWDEELWRALWQGIANSSAERTGITALLATTPASTLSAVAPDIARWLGYTKHERTQLGSDFLELWDLVCPLLPGDPSEDYKDPLATAFNSPIGQLCKAILDAFIATSPKRATGLPEPVRTRIERLLLSDNPQIARPAQMIASAYLHALHLVDRGWTQSVVLPLFHWNYPLAVSAWQCYLHNQHWYPDLISDLKPALLEALSHREQLGERGRYLCMLLANIAMSSSFSLPDDELTDALRRLDRTGLVDFCEAVGHMVQNADKGPGADLWNSAIRRVIHLLPLDQEKRSPDLADRLADLAIATGDSFDEAARLIKVFMMPVSRRDFGSVAYKITKSDLPERFPITVLDLLAAIIQTGGDPPYLHTEASRLLQRVRATAPESAETPGYRRLANSGWFDLG